MSKRRHKPNKHQKKTRPQRMGESQNTRSRFQIEKRLPIGGFSITYGSEQPTRLSNWTYEVSNPDTGQTKVVRISQELLSTLSEAKALLHFGLGYPLTSDRIAASWPQQWRYLSEEQRNELENLGLYAVSKKYLLTASLHVESFGERIYFQTNVPGFFDAWIEIIWQEYVVEIELNRFQSLYKSVQSTKMHTQVDGLILHNAEAWIPLENCAVRIRSMRERLARYIIPLYFFGEKFIGDVDKKQWKELDAQIRKILNQQQTIFYDLFFQFWNDTQNDALKSLRDDLIHNLSQRPSGVISSKIQGKALINTVDELYQLVQREHSRIREAILLVTAVIRARTPLNKILPESSTTKYE